MFEHLLNVVTKSAPGNDNDFADRLNYRYTAAVYMLMSMAVIGKDYIAEPIECWTPSFFETPWVDYTNNLCFVKSTYYLPMHTPIEEGKANNETYLISYYQWIPLFFMMLAMCFYVPRAVWFNVFSHHFVDINAIVDLLTSFDNAVNPETRDPAVMQVAKHIDRYLNSTVEYRTHPYFRLRKYLSKKNVFVLYCGRRYGLAIATIYLSLKLCYIIIGFLQVYYIDMFMIDEDYSIWNYYTNIFSRSYVIKVLLNLANNETKLESSPTFPRITMCEFQVRTLGEVLTYNVQCVLPLNLFNEKIFLFLWMWIVFVLLATCTNMVAWFWRIAISWNREHYIMKHLKLLGKLDAENMRHHRKITKKLMRYFIHHYLRPDGVFLLRLISINTNCLISSEIIGALWENFLDHPFVVKRAETYHNQLQEMGVIRAEDENKVLASLKAMNLKASRSTLDNDEDCAPMRAKSRQFSIFDPETPLSLEAPPEGKKRTTGKKFSSQFTFKDKEAVNNQASAAQTKRRSRGNTFDALEEHVNQGQWGAPTGQTKRRSNNRRGLEVPREIDSDVKPKKFDKPLASFTAKTKSSWMNFAFCGNRAPRSSSLDALDDVRVRSSVLQQPATHFGDGGDYNPGPGPFRRIDDPYRTFMQPSAPQQTAMGPLQSLLSDEAMGASMEGRVEPPPYGDFEIRKAEF